MKLPPWPTSDTINRTTYVQVPISVPNGNIRIKFGYGENGDPSLGYCTTRQEACWTTTAASGSSPFVFAGGDARTSLLWR